MMEEECGDPVDDPSNNSGETNYPQRVANVSLWLRCKELLCTYMLDVGGSMAAAVSIAPSSDSLLWKLGNVEECINDAIR